MDLFTISMSSRALHKRTQLNVLAPADAPAPCKVLWALHGMTDDHTGWLRSTAIDLLAEEYGLVVVMPNADLSFYVDMAYGADYFTFLAEELPEFIAKHFGTSRHKEDNYLVGNSMGGYGAFYTALNHPERYAAAVSLSGPMRIDWIYRVLSDDGLANAFASGDRQRSNAAAHAVSDASGVPLALIHSLMEFGDDCTVRTFRAMFGLQPRLRGNHYDLFHLAQKLAESDIPLKLIAYCGEQDYHYSSNIQFAEYMSSRALDYRLTTGEGGHDWCYWNPAAEAALRTLMR